MTKPDRASEPSASFPQDDSSSRDDAGKEPFRSMGNLPPALRSAAEAAMLQPIPMMVLWGSGGRNAIANAPARILFESLGSEGDSSLVPEEAYSRALGGASLLLTDRRLGEDRRFDLGIGPVRDASGSVAGALVTIVETTRLAQAEQALRVSTQQDPLTGVPNRELFRDRLSLALMVTTEAHAKLGLLIVNLDQFARINERFGHAAGDQALKTAAERIAGELRDNDLLARLGSDEFVVIQSDVTDLAGVTGLARRLSSIISEPVEFEGELLPMSASFGLTVFPDHGTDGTILLRNADLALRKAQEIGPGEIYVFDPAITRSAERRRDLEVDFRRAIDRGEMVLHYQPQFDLTTRRPRAVEALVRWRKSESELLHPRHFMSLVTGSSLVVPLGEWILHEAARQARAWEGVGSGMRVAVNVSHGEAARPEFLEAFDRAVASAGIPSDRIEFEITGAILADHQNARISTFLEGCRLRGIGLVIDDFGVGYSSSGYLRDLIIEKVKIDLSFVAGVGDEENEALLEIMVDEGHRLGRRVVAEGVENEAQFAFLRSIGCDDAQGNLLCPTGPAEAVLRQLGTAAGGIRED